MLGNLLFYGLFGGLALLEGLEILHWQKQRHHPLKKRIALARLARRSLGLFCLALTLALVRDSHSPGMAPLESAWRQLIAIAFCILAILVALWDFRKTRRDLQREVDDFLKDSARDLQNFIRASKDSQDDA